MEMNYDENVRYDLSPFLTFEQCLIFLQTLHQLEEELHVQVVPGTEIMKDVGSHHFVKSSAQSGPVLVPQPSDDPHDPLVSDVSICFDDTNRRPRRHQRGHDGHWGELTC